MSKIIIFIILTFSLLFVNCSSKKDVQIISKNSAENKDIGNKSNDFQKDEITIKTPDGIYLSANYFCQTNKKETIQPVIVLVHQFNEDKEQWADNFIDSLLINNFKVFAYDIRGHGKSSKVNYELTKLLSDPKEAPNDVIAVFSWLKKQAGIDSTKICTMGTSMGGNLAFYARYFLDAACVVSVSNSKDGFYTYMGIDDRRMTSGQRKISNVLFICGKHDGKHAEDEQYLMDNYIESPKDIKIYDSDKHGIFLIRENPEIYSLAINWFKKFL